MWLQRAGLGVLMLVLTFSARVSAQTTQPAESWSDAMGRLTDALRGNKLAALTGILDRGPVLRTFASDTLVPPERLLGATSGSKLLGTHAYLKVPTSLATDLSDDFKSADVPDGLRRDMVVSDPATERAANDTAAHWVAQILQPVSEQTIGVIVLWRREKSDSFSSSASNRPLFVLVKADLVDGQYVFRQVTFGDPLDKKR